MEKQLNEIYQAEIAALRQELHLTRNFIYRELQLTSDISAETTQMMIDEYIKNVKQENY